jgi:hypothetical protein
MRVVIVGPSPCILNLNLGSIIDTYDTVCRVNQSYMCAVKYPSCYGIRNDVQFFANNNYMYSKIENILKLTTNPAHTSLKRTHYTTIGKYKGLNSKRIKQFFVKNKIKYNLVYYPEQYIQSTGILSILEILKWSNVTELFIVGFSFHNEKNFYTDNIIVEDKYRFHDEDNEKHVFENIILKHPTIKVTAHSTTMEALGTPRQGVAPLGVIPLSDKYQKPKMVR